MEINHRQEIAIEGALELETLQTALASTAIRLCQFDPTSSSLHRINELHDIVECYKDGVTDSINSTTGAKEACEKIYRFEFSAKNKDLILGALVMLGGKQKQEGIYSVVAISMLSEIDTQQSSPL